MSEPLLVARNLTKAFGALLATNALCLDVMPGEIHAVIGPNGAGKTTAIAQLSGELLPDSGNILFSGKKITNLPVYSRSQLGLARSFQISSLFLGFTAEDNVSMAFQAQDGHSFCFWKKAGNDERLRRPAREVLDQVGLIDRADIIASNLSHGEQRQLDIAMALATKPTMLLLDEPMAGMGAEESNRMVELLRHLKGTVTILLVEHDMGAVFSLADRITVLVDGQAIATGQPESIRENLKVRQAYLGQEA